jgi:hypothetical protein
MDSLRQLEQLGFVVWVRESGSLLGYATFLFMHTLGLTTLAGVSAGIDLRLLGFAPKLPLAPMTRLFPLMWAALALTAFSGVVLLMTDMTKLVQPVFMVKLSFIALAVIVLRLLRARVFNDPQVDAKPLAANARFMALASLLSWVGATTAGRLMAYLTPAGGGGF